MPSFYESYYKVRPGTPRILKDVLVAIHMVRDKGLARTAENIRRALMARVHVRLFDRALNARLPVSTAGSADVDGMTLVMAGAETDLDEIFYAPCPVKCVVWPVEALPTKLERFTFLDCGSGMGFAMAAAAAFPFRRILGVEFAKELAGMCVTNIEATRNFPQTQCRDISVLHASILEFAIPAEPLVVFMFNPFKTEVMQAWLARLEKSFMESPREIWVIYVNPDEHDVFKNFPRLVRVAPKIRTRIKLKFLSPFDADIYRFDDGSSASPPIAGKPHD